MNVKAINIRISVYVNKSVSPILDVMRQTLINCLGIVIRELRNEAGMIQVEFAEKCGFYQTYLSRIENGKSNPTINAIDVIAKSLGISVFGLMDLVKLKLETSNKTSR